MGSSVKIRLTLMMLLEYAIWGAWAPVLFAYLTDPVAKGGLGFNGVEGSVIYSMLPLASIVAPFLAGQLADRLFASERLLGALHLFGGGSLIVMASRHDYRGMLYWMLGFSLLYAPTLALTNVIAFRNLSNTEKEFGGIRVGGTIGWIISGLVLTLLRNRFPTATPHGWSDSLFLAGIMALLLGVFSFSLPHTPPKREGVNPWAFIEAFKLLKDKNFAVFVGVSFIVATELQFYYVLTGKFLQDRMGIAPENVPGWMTLAQIAEIVVMAVLLPKLLPIMGIRKTMVVGILAWPIRYVIFALGALHPELKWLVIASLTLHGFCYVFFFTVGFIYVDEVAHSDIRASAQGLIALVVLGVGSYMGTIFTGKIQDAFTNAATNSTDWFKVFLVPCVLTILCAIVFPLLFRAQPTTAKPDAEAVAAG